MQALWAHYNQFEKMGPMLDTIRNRLEAYGPRLIKVEAPEKGNPKSGKRAIEHGFQLSPYEWDAPEIQDWISAGGNYGVLLGKGLLGIDADNLELFEAFPPTLTDTYIIAAT